MGTTSCKSLEAAELLTRKDIENIENSWNAIESKEKLGVDIMVRLFLAHKELKIKWIFASNLETEEEMRENSQLNYHARNIITVFGSCVQKIIKSNPENINVEDLGLHKLGTKHYHYGVKRADFVHFEESFFYALKKNAPSKMKMTRGILESWKKALDLVINQMSNGIEKECADRNGQED